MKSKTDGPPLATSGWLEVLANLKPINRNCQTRVLKRDCASLRTQVIASQTFFSETILIFRRILREALHSVKKAQAKKLTDLQTALLDRQTKNRQDKEKTQEAEVQRQASLTSRIQKNKSLAQLVARMKDWSIKDQARLGDLQQEIQVLQPQLAQLALRGVEMEQESVSLAQRVAQYPAKNQALAYAVETSGIERDRLHSVSGELAKQLAIANQRNDELEVRRQESEAQLNSLVVSRQANNEALIKKGDDISRHIHQRANLASEYLAQKMKASESVKKMKDQISRNDEIIQCLEETTRRQIERLRGAPLNWEPALQEKLQESRDTQKKNAKTIKANQLRLAELELKYASLKATEPPREDPATLNRLQALEANRFQLESQLQILVKRLKLEESRRTQKMENQKVDLCTTIIGCTQKLDEINEEIQKKTEATEELQAELKAFRTDCAEMLATKDQDRRSVLLSRWSQLQHIMGEPRWPEHLQPVQWDLKRVGKKKVPALQG